jgi:hypothetical protein
VAWYDLLLYLFLSSGLLKPSTPLPGPIDLRGQLLFVLTLSLLAIVTIYYFEPFHYGRDPETIRKSLAGDLVKVTPTLLGGTSVGIPSSILPPTI